MVLANEWLPEAREDLAAELEYVYNEFDSKTAERVYLKVLESIDILCRFPRLGKVFSGVAYHGEDVRTLSMGQTALIYCLRNDILLVVAVWNNRRDEKGLNAMIQSR